jgi:predicted DNA-binding transcriptional regulator AlpA
MRLLSHRDLHARGITFTRQWLHKLIQEARFPRPVKAGKNRNFWIEAEIDQYLSEIAAKRDRNAA